MARVLDLPGLLPASLRGRSAVHPKPRYVDATKLPGSLRRLYAAFATTRLSRFISRHVNWKLDPVLSRATRGRISTTLMIRSAVLETYGARTGALRRNNVIYFHDGEDVIITASHAGADRNPGWFYNLVANPLVTFGGNPMRATVVEDEGEQERLCALADRVFPAFARFRRVAAAAGRSVPIIRLTPRETNPAAASSSATEVLGGAPKGRAKGRSRAALR
jgi:deazaflavin-dependent oxidoreductase (nitroreductase family)